MRQLIVLSVLLLGAVWAAAQNYPNQTSSGQTSSSNSSASTSAGTGTTIQGCLSGSGGNYTLTDKSGTTYQLTGDTAKLNEHVGHEVKVTGTAESAAGSASASGASASGSMGQSSTAQQTFQVSSVKHVSKTCRNSGGMSH